MKPSFLRKMVSDFLYTQKNTFAIH